MLVVAMIENKMISSIVIVATTSTAIWITGLGLEQEIRMKSLELHFVIHVLAIAIVKNTRIATHI